MIAPFSNLSAESKVIFALMIYFENILCSQPLYGTYYVMGIIPNAFQILTHSIFITSLLGRSPYCPPSIDGELRHRKLR